MPPAIPVATYRLQFTADFTFDDAANVVPYLKSLGVTHVYASPFLKARKGSTHGYDIVDHNAINPELGGEFGFDRFSAILKAQDLGLILDFVPNHMGVHYADNVWWLDALEWGQKSPHAAAFDIDWDMLPFRKKPGVLLPILGTPYGQALASGDIELRYDENEGSFSAWYFEHRLPITPACYSEILRAIVGVTGTGSQVSAQLMAISEEYAGPNNPSRSHAPALKQAIRSVDDARDLIREGLLHYRAGDKRPSQTQALHNLLERQNYRLAHWRLATSEINYRRFFDVNTLAGLRVEDRSVFDRIHALVRRLITEDKLQGLRLDHIDGLRDPAQYFNRLRQLIRSAQSSNRKPFYLLIEKILGDGEDLPRFSDVAGTTGYEWLNDITQVLADQTGLDPLDDIWRQASNSSPDFEPVLRKAKQRVLETLLASEFTVLVRLVARIAAGHYSTRDFSEDSLRQALQLYVLHFPVYRTYIAGAPSSDAARALIGETMEKARHEWFGADDGIFDFLREALTLDLVQKDFALSQTRAQRFAHKMQQFTGPLMAKSLEDTAFYRYHRLLAFNEVGGAPAAPAMTVDEFNKKMHTRARDWPHGLTSTATHDTKRGEDARARILSLTEIPGEWASAVARWKVLNAGLITTTNGVRSPSLADEYMIYQALIGAMPNGPVDDSFIERMQAYALKAIREAKLHTSWLNPNTDYEAGISRFLTSILNRSQSPAFLESLKHFSSRTSLLGALNSLSQLALKATMPGIPDFYQGSELWELSLVDPDNRRPVDYELRASILRALEPNRAWLADNWHNGHVKLAATHRLLSIRSEHSEVFCDGQYIPLPVEGRHRNHILAYARVLEHKAVIVAVARHFSSFVKSDGKWPDWKELQASIDLNDYRAEHSAFANSVLDIGAAFDVLPMLIIPATLRKVPA